MTLRVALMISAGPERGAALWAMICAQKRYQKRQEPQERLEPEAAQAAHPFRLRDVRRLLSRPEALLESGKSGAFVHSLEEACRVHLGETFSTAMFTSRIGQIRLAARLTDRLISRFGPDELLERLVPELRERAREVLEQHLREFGESRPKWTQEIAELVSGTSTAVHGGDGNSGEVDHLAETSSKEARESHDLNGSPRPGSAATGSGGTAPTAQGPETPADSASAQADAAGSDRAGEEPSADRAAGRAGRESDGAANSAAEGGSADLSRADQDRDPAGAKAEGADGDPNRGEAPAADSGDIVAGGGPGTDRSPGSPSIADGLDEVRLNAMREAEELRRDAAEVVRQLRRIIIEASGVGSPSPRIDGRRLARELVSRRYRMSAARRREFSFGDLVIAVDESGSCWHVVATTLPAARAIAREIGARAVVVEHFNGDIDMQAESIRDWPAWLIRALNERAPGERRSDSVWRAIVRRRPRLVLALGDFDSHEQFEEMAQAGQRLVLLTHLEQDVIANAPAPTYQVIWGVSDIHSAARALRAAKIQIQVRRKHEVRS